MKPYLKRKTSNKKIKILTIQPFIFRQKLFACLVPIAGRNTQNAQMT
jgi:hypothetical protein